MHLCVFTSFSVRTVKPSAVSVSRSVGENTGSYTLQRSTGICTEKSLWVTWKTCCVCKHVHGPDCMPGVSLAGFVHGLPWEHLAGVAAGPVDIVQTHTWKSCPDRNTHSPVGIHSGHLSDLYRTHWTTVLEDLQTARWRLLKINLSWDNFSIYNRLAI